MTKSAVAPLERQASNPECDLALKRNLNILQGVSIIMGVIVGSGIYATPQAVLEYAGSAFLSLVLWVAGGLFNLLGAICFAEIGTRYKVAGEKYAYLKVFYGSFLAFTFVWQYAFLMRPGSNAVKILVLSRHLLKPLFLTCAVPTAAANLLSSVFAILIGFLNSISVRKAVKCQEFMTSITLLTLAILAGAGINEFLKGERKFETIENSESVGFESIIMGFYPAVYSFYGWSTLNFLIEELKDPYKNLPRAVIFSMLILIVLFVLVNISYFLILGTDGILRSEAVAINVAMKAFGPAGWIISAFIAVTACSGYNSGILIGSRMVMAGARTGQLPHVFSFISLNYITPVISIILQCLLSLVYVWLLDVNRIIQNVVYSYLVFDFLASLGYIRVRVKGESTIPFHFKVPLMVHLLYCLILGVLVLAPLITNVGKSPEGFLTTTGISVVLYYLFVVNKTAKNWTGELFGNSSIWLQKLMLCAPESHVS